MEAAFYSSNASNFFTLNYAIYTQHACLKSCKNLCLQAFKKKTFFHVLVTRQVLEFDVDLSLSISRIVKVTDVKFYIIGYDS